MRYARNCFSRFGRGEKMMQGDTGGALWGVITIAGPILLALVLAIAMLRNRRSRAEKVRSEQAVRDQHNEDRRAEGVPPKTTPVAPD
jgi:hypothetical protein